MPVRTLLVVPGMDRLYRSPDCHVLIGTPGKLLDICKRTLDARTVSIFVLDEADMMLDSSNAMGPQVLQIRKLLPEKLQVLFFSATYPDDVRQFAESLVPRAMSIRVRKTELTVSSVNQFYTVACGKSSHRASQHSGWRLFDERQEAVLCESLCPEVGDIRNVIRCVEAFGATPNCRHT
ncbi:unnamed protein product [Prorocentrum cordatum]|uniref:Helicase ATP-binding domain-containing protein n=1 Tax=Prorocentrum cordatum TaxID=2364126 RepID=A0ABN9T0K2_9DINO|nr:unnamed protein product [Polarella glacialis]